MCNCKREDKCCREDKCKRKDKKCCPVKQTFFSNIDENTVIPTVKSGDG